MIVLHHLPRTGGTFLRHQLKVHLAPGPEVSFGSQRLTPRLMCDTDYRPRVLVYHCSGAEFLAAYRRRGGDFLLTFVRDPVELVYSNFHYMSARWRRGDVPVGQRAEWRYYERDLSAHVDEVIEGTVRVGWLHTDLDCYDFVGVTERMPESIALLNAALGLRLAAGPPLNTVDGERSYRRAELAAVLAEQCALYQTAVRRLAASDPRRRSSRPAG